MKAIAALTAIAVLLPGEFLRAQSGASANRDYPVKPVPFTSVHVNDAFWAPRIETNRKVTIPFAFQKDEETGRVDLFVRAAKALRGEPLDNRKPPGYPFDDTDVYKVIEGASYSLSVHPDPKLEAYVDDLIAKIGAAQEKDGYLYTTRSIDPLNPHPWASPERWLLEGVLSHELYNLGHLYEAAAAHYQATGKRSLLDIALRSAGLLDSTFGPGKASIWPGHQIIEMGLAKLYRVTGEQRYVNLAKFMLDERGPGSREGAGKPYTQSHMKVVEQTEAVGHAVRATYMYSGMADIAALTSDTGYVNAIDKIWDNVAGKKLYITGGIGARAAGEAFGDNYELPNMSAYNETCAAVGNDYWNHRLFLLHADAKYIDVMERTLYNGLISGVSLDGKSFFYPNPLESKGQHQRQPWFGVACCPGNITRFMASVPGYVYAQRGDALWINLFMASNAEVKMDNGRTVKLTQITRYPWDGAVKVTLDPDQSAALTIHVRIPGWARGEPVASDLYHYVDRSNRPVTVRVNGKTEPVTLDKGYVALNRTWKKGDTIELNLPMAARRVAANGQVSADRGRVAIERGPIVYATEWPDNPGGKVRNLVLADNQPLAAEFKPGLLNGVTVVKAKAIALSLDDQGGIVRKQVAMTAIPYYAWANRGAGQMIVWLPNTEAGGTPAKPPTLASAAKVTTSGRKSPQPVTDDDDPRSSRDNSYYFDWRPAGTAPDGDARLSSGWIEYALAKPSLVSESELYWFDDAPGGGVRMPASWRILYKDGAQWKPLENPAGWGIERDRYNKVSFKAVTTSALRLEVNFQPDFSAGVQRWKVQ
jgi:uncharacterized protein